MLPLRLNDRTRTRTKKPASSTSKKARQRSSLARSGPSSTKDHIPTDHSSASSSSTRSARKRRSSMPGVDSASRPATASFLESRVSLPYPAFSKAHSREAVRPNIPTPDATDVTEQRDGANGTGHNRTESHHVPPSPPLTSEGQRSSRKGTPVGDRDEKGTEEKSQDGKAKIRIKTGSTKSSPGLRTKKDEGSKSSKTARPNTPSKAKTPKGERDAPSGPASPKSPKSRISEEGKLPKRPTSHTVTSPRRASAPVRDAGSESANGSDATIGPRHSTGTQKWKAPVEKPPSRDHTRSSGSFRCSDNRAPFDGPHNDGRSPTANSGYGTPPPPPPPPEMPVSIPRVDYLLQNGGLRHNVPRSLLQGAGGVQDAPYRAAQPQATAARVFEPFSQLLDDYQQVMNKSGSLAVATGYRSVARRLLDRLEAVFARDISSESCCCVMCEQDEMHEPEHGVSWGEVLELVSGRRELPSWPPFTMASSVADAGASGDDNIPMQKMDVDIPEEYREHFVRQSRKTKHAVDKWLYEQSEQATSAPDEVDDETLMFAMLTHLEPEKRSLFCALLGISSTTPVPRLDGQRPPPGSEVITSSGLAIQRLYRLRTAPRDPETTIFMVNNPGMHHVLATLAAISDDEWEILISGRFDGFLRSGAEDTNQPPSSTPSRWGSRSGTPYTPGGASRGATPSVDGSFRPASQPSGGTSSPASFGGPIALDEETEIAALAEIERDVYLGMEALEDAFEALHCKAETVRLALRERGAGLSMANQSRRGSTVEARLGTPAQGQVFESAAEDDYLDDLQSLAPDDSASNVSSSRRRRPKRRTERRTPAPVEEEDEGVVEPKSPGSRRGFWRR